MSKVKIKIDSKNFIIDISEPLDISIPYNFDGEQPNFFDVEPGSIAPLVYDNISYDGSSGCNVPIFNINIHCTGTHTETIGHILDDREFPLNSILPVNFLTALVITIEPSLFIDSNESYHTDIDNSERVITCSDIKEKIESLRDISSNVLIIRTLPNCKDKMFNKYIGNMHPFFTSEAIRFISSLGIQHLIVDTPSIDRADDGAQLLNHKIFWNIEGSTDNKLLNRTITELCFIHNYISDGHYLIQFLFPNFVSHVAPTRPILYKCRYD